MDETTGTDRRAAAQGRITDDGAVVGIASLAGTMSLALSCLQAGAVIGLVLLLARRVLPTPARRAAGSAVLAGTAGGALFVHGHESFDFTVLQPAWLVVAIFEPSRLVPLGVLALVQPPAMAAAALAYGVALLVATTGALDRRWRGRVVTAVGTGLFVALVARGLHDLTADVVSLAT